MNKWIAPFALCVLMLGATAGPAWSQGTDAVKASAPAADDAPPKPAALPTVESVDILKQNQAQRTKDQPGNLAPTFRIVNSGQKNYSSLPDPEASILIQPKAQFPGQARATTAGEAWRQYRNGPLTKIGGWLFIAALFAVAAMYFLRGRIMLKEPRTGRLIERFTSIERTAHWTVAISFVTLALTGLTMLFGKYVVLPLFGHTLFGWLAYVCKGIHNFVGPIFAISIIVFFIIFVKDNLPAASDLSWFAKLGGLFGKHASAGRFNAGEKVWFWGAVVVLGLIVSASGFVLDMLVPNFEYTRGNLQIANIIHISGAVLVASAALGHIYIGTLGMEGAFEAMGTGYVDDTWAKEHHDEWYADIQSGKVPRVRTREGASVVTTPGGPVKGELA